MENIHYDRFNRPIKVGNYLVVNGNPVKVGLVTKTSNRRSITIKLLQPEMIPNPSYNPREYNHAARTYELRDPTKPLDWAIEIVKPGSLHFGREIYVQHTRWNTVLIGGPYLGDNVERTSKEAISNLTV